MPRYSKISNEDDEDDDDDDDNNNNIIIIKNYERIILNKEISKQRKLY